jgi:hypothetical protein
LDRILDLEEKNSDMKNKSRIEHDDRMDLRRLSIDSRQRLESR